MQLSKNPHVEESPHRGGGGGGRTNLDGRVGCVHVEDKPHSVRHEATGDRGEEAVAADAYASVGLGGHQYGTHRKKVKQRGLQVQNDGTVGLKKKKKRF